MQYNSHIITRNRNSFSLVSKRRPSSFFHNWLLSKFLHEIYQHRQILVFVGLISTFELKSNSVFLARCCWILKKDKCKNIHVLTSKSVVICKSTVFLVSDDSVISFMGVGFYVERVMRARVRWRSKTGSKRFN